MHRVVLAVAIALAGLVPVSAADRVVHVYNWSDYIDPKVLEDFTKDTGIQVVYDTFDSNDVLETKLLAGKTDYDVVVPSASYLQRLVGADIFLKLDKAKVPNLKYAWPEIAARLATYDPGNLHAVNYMWGTTGIGFNVTKANERLGNQAVNTWDVVFKPELLAKFKSCGVHVLDAADEIIPAALNYLGINPDSKNPADFEKAGALLAKIRPSIQKFHSSEYINGLAGGDICFAVGWSGDVYQAKKRAEEAAAQTKKPVVPVDYVLPKEGALMWFDSFAIPKDAPHVEEAYAFIDYMMRPEIAARNSNFISYANGNLESQKLIPTDILNNPSIYPDAETMKRLYITTTYAPDVQRVLTRVWTRFKTGR
jgi:putrescine transport system substrate-binding protein